MCQKVKGFPQLSGKKKEIFFKKKKKKKKMKKKKVKKNWNQPLTVSQFGREWKEKNKTQTKINRKIIIL